MRFIVTIVIIFFLVVFGVIIFGHGSNKTKTPAPQVKTLADYAGTDVDMRFTTIGPITGDDTHREIVITIGRDSRTIQVIQGYQGDVLKTKSFTNNDQAYSAFLSALNVANYTKERKTKITTDAGQCSLGDRFIYEITNNGNGDTRSWSTSCGPGSFGGDPNLTNTLFQAQITGYDDYVSDVAL